MSLRAPKYTDTALPEGPALEKSYGVRLYHICHCAVQNVSSPDVPAINVNAQSRATAVGGQITVARMCLLGVQHSDSVYCCILTLTTHSPLRKVIFPFSLLSLLKIGRQPFLFVILLIEFHASPQTKCFKTYDVFLIKNCCCSS